ncbi:ABC transporter substrate-binding protein [Laceyella putida]|uniref:ABC transporter substrate-binding protein n=1 Tax=Laceyella putida TaxID=110101 RepID=A0ABW2RF82_9BACL
MIGLKKHFLRSLLVFSAMLIALVGCSSSPAPKEKATEQTRTIQHAMGTTKVPAEPKRVVVLTNEGLEAALALGVKPVGAVESFTAKPFYKHLLAETKGVKTVGNEHEPNLETIASLKPDLIIGNKMRQEKVYSQLNAIAPTVFAEELRGDWKVNFDLYAKALNKEAEGKKVLADYEKKVQEVKQNAGDLLQQKVSVIRFMAGKTRIYQQQSFTGVLLKDVGFARTELGQKDDFAMEISKEQIPQGDGDIIFYFTYDEGDKKGDAQEQEITNDPLWKNLTAVKNNRAFKVDDVIWNTAGGVKAAMIMLDQLNGIVNQIKQAK